MKKKTIIITGAGGYIGSVMTKYFLDKGFNVKAVDRFYFGEEVLDDYLPFSNLEIIKEDIRYLSKEIFDGVDFVIDLASLSNDPAADLNPKLTKDINIDGAIRIAKLAKKSGISRYVYASSCSVYGKNEGQKLTEKSSLHPVSLYAKAKIAVEKELLSLSDDNFVVTIGRNATCYGLSPRMRFDLVVNIMTKQAFQDRIIKITGGGKQWRPLVHIFDVIRAYHLFLELPINLVQKQIFNIGSDEQNYQISTLAKLVKNHFIGCNTKLLSGDIDKRDYNVSFNKLKKNLGFETKKTIDDAVKNIKEALKNNSAITDIRSVTVNYYKYLLEMDQKLENIKYNGKIF